MPLNVIESSVKNNLSFILAHLSRNHNNDHTNIDKFQDALLSDLNMFSPNCWEKEYAPSYEHKDRIDIFGQINKNEKWIIEIDALRTDQVTQKFTSRVALLGQKEPINYVAILYPFSRSNKNGCIKYLKYIHDILNLINKESKVYGFFIDFDNNSNLKVYLIDFSKIKFRVNNGNPIIGMRQCAKEAIKQIMTQKCYKKIEDATQDLDPFVKDKKGKSREIPVGMKTGDGKDVYCCTQWKYFGNQRNWGKFVEKCNEYGVYIKEDWF